MKISSLKNILEDKICQERISVAGVHPEKGIMFMFPRTSYAGDIANGDLFIGYKNDYDALLLNGCLLDGATYILADAERDEPVTVIKKKSYNLITVSLSLNQILARLDGLFNPRIEEEEMSESRMFISFWRDIKNGRLTEENEIRTRVRDFPYRMKRYCAIIIIRNIDTVDTGIEFKKVQIRHFFPETNLFFYGGECIVFYTQDGQTTDGPAIDYEEFSHFLANNHLVAGVSFCSYWVFCLYSIYLTADAAINLGTALSNPFYPKYSNIYTVKDYQSLYTVYLAAKQFVETHKKNNIFYLVHPDVVHLYEVEQRGNEHLLDVLIAFLMCKCNAEETSKRLFIHRSTLYKKLNRIEEALGKPIREYDSLFNLELSCLIVLFQHYFENRRIIDTPFE